MTNVSKRAALGRVSPNRLSPTRLSPTRLSLGAKILAALILAMLVGLAITTVAISDRSSGTTQDLSIQSGRELASGVASGVQRDLNVAMRVTETMRDAYVGLYRQGIKDRATYLAMLESAVKANPQYVAVWTAWEPNALDGKDAQFVNADGKASFEGAKAHDATGRFVPYVFSTPDGFDLSPLTDYDKPGAGDYYLLAQKSGKQQIVEPYPYVVGSKTVIMTSLVTPIVIDGQVEGVVGLDLDLAAIQERLAKIKPYETGSVSLISAQGNWAANADPKQVMKPIDAADAALGDAKARVAKGERFELDRHSDVLDTDVKEVFAPVEVGVTGTPWTVLVDLPKDKILAPAKSLTWFTVIAALVLVLVLSAIVAVLVRCMVSRPLGRLTATIDALASDNTTIDVPDTGRSDELGVMARAINVFREKLIKMAGLRERQLAAEQTAKAEQQKMLHDLADGFERSVKGIVDSVSNAAVQLQGNAQSMSGVADASMQQAGAVAAAVTQASANVATVATASEELSASIAEITRQVAESASSTREAVADVAQTGDTITRLNDAANRIGGIVQLINDIASQTNLLALNATIEAARAGEAGKGFAVVASEVKQLATQTAKATDEIKTQIDSMQSITKTAVEAIGTISGKMDRINEISGAIAAAVEEQSAATREISNNAQQAAAGTDEVNRNITGVSNAAQDVSGASGAVLQAAGQLSSESDQLRQEVETFIARVRAG